MADAMVERVEESNPQDITRARTALRLVRHLGTSPQLWRNLRSATISALTERDQGARSAANVGRGA
jgi:plasmid maintenance system antidote protein VapI